MRDGDSSELRQEGGPAGAPSVAYLDEVDAQLALARAHEIRRALRFLWTVIGLLAVVGVVSFDGDWSMLGAVGGAATVFGVVSWRAWRQTGVALPPGYRGLSAEIIGRGRSTVPVRDADHMSPEDLVRIQDELDVLDGRRAITRSVMGRVAPWVGGIGSLAWLAVGVSGAVARQPKAMFMALACSGLFGFSTLWARKLRHETADAAEILENERSTLRRAMEGRSAVEGADDPGALPPPGGL